MTMRAHHGLKALTEKEKETLRLIVRGHDAKSIARNLDLSVHTINGRLRDARRKMAASSSREAARQLLDAEGWLGSPTPELLGDKEIGADAVRESPDQEPTPISGARRRLPLSWILIGGVLMTIALALVALAVMPESAPPAQTAQAQEAANSEAASTARQWLELLDQRRWKDSYQSFSSAFQKMNSEKVWASASEKVRAPLGVATSREFVSEEDLPAPPHGYEVVKFRTHFANRAGTAIETVTLDREGGAWRVAGVYVE